MIKSVKDEDHIYWQVRDLDTGELIRGVQWVDDETGEYDQRVSGEGTKRRHGRIRLEDIREVI